MSESSCNQFFTVEKVSVIVLRTSLPNTKELENTWCILGLLSLWARTMYTCSEYLLSAGYEGEQRGYSCSHYLQ